MSRTKIMAKPRAICPVAKNVKHHNICKAKFIRNRLLTLLRCPIPAMHNDIKKDIINKTYITDQAIENTMLGGVSEGSGISKYQELSPWWVKTEQIYAVSKTEVNE